MQLMCLAELQPQRVYAAYALVHVAAAAGGCRAQSDQEMVDYLASNLLVEYYVIDNTAVGNISNQWTGEMFLTNTGTSDVTSLSWQIYFCCIRLMEYDTTRPGPENGAELGDSGVEVYHVDGCLHKLQPMAEFTGLGAGVRLQLPFTAGDWMVSRTDAMPRQEPQHSHCVIVRPLSQRHIIACTFIKLPLPVLSVQMVRNDG